MSIERSDLVNSEIAKTHEVVNQPTELEDYNLYETDEALKEVVDINGAAWANEELADYGAVLGSAETLKKGHLANENKPLFHTHDRFGHRTDLVEFHPAYHYFMDLAISNGMHSSPWTDPKLGSHVKRAAQEYMQYQVEAGHICPITMTFACVPTFQKQPDLAEKLLSLITARYYDPSNVPVEQKKGITIGMAMTEKQGGSDVRSNSTLAFSIGVSGAGKAYELVGHKFFVSAPMSDAFLVLAKTDKGLSCFYMPRWRPDGSKNPCDILSLKEKMGNVSNASSEMELRGAYAVMIGEEGRGVANILDMVAHTRFDCLVSSAGLMRQAVAQITHHCTHRSAFGKKLIEQPLMQNVLADLIVEQEAALHFAMRIGRSLDEGIYNEQEQALMRIGTAIGKYWVCKRAGNHVLESMEVIGGSGVMERCIMPRLYREAPVNSIWEGSGNVQCLDVLRILSKSPQVVNAYFDEVNQTKGQSSSLDQLINKLGKSLKDHDNIEYRARHITETMALALQASLLIRYGNKDITNSFLDSRLGSSSGRVFGTLPAGINCKAIINRACPYVD